MNKRWLLVAAAMLIVVGISGVVSLMTGESDELSVIDEPSETSTVSVTLPDPVTPTEAQTIDQGQSDGVAELQNQVLPGSITEEPIPKEPVTVPATPAVVLPRLDDSDPLFRDSVVNLSRIESLNGWLGGENLIRKTVLVIDNLARGQLVREPLAIIAPSQPFSVFEISEDRFELNPVSYQRFDPVVEIFDSLDSRRTAELYVLLHPLFEEAWQELGYQEGRFQTVLFQAVGRLLETPEIDGSIGLIRPAVMYEFADERLESLGSAQKQLLRMGPDNTRKIKRKLRELALEVRSQLATDE